MERQTQEEKQRQMERMMKVLSDTANVRIGGSREELACAEYIKNCCEEFGGKARLEAFEVELADMEQAELWADGVSIPCKGYRCAGSGEVEAPFYYLSNTDEYSLSQCRGKIVMIDTGLGYWMYQDLLNNGAVGIISYDGDANYADEDIDWKELRNYVSNGKKMPCVSIHAKSAIQLIKKNTLSAKIILKQNEYMGESHNVVLDLPGEVPEMIVLTAHYDSTPLSQGVYDNMSGCVGLLEMARYFSSHAHRYSLRFIWCGSEERGLLGSKAYTAVHEKELSSVVLNINLDMIGSVMGRFIAVCTAEEKLVHYIAYMAAELGVGIAARQSVYSSDSTPFADKGVPALSFARIAPRNTATIHNRYDTLEVMKAEHMAKDVAFITAFTKRMACAKHCPVAREIPDNMKEKLDIYLNRKRDKSKQ